jgi:hypothetical protein
MFGYADAASVVVVTGTSPGCDASGEAHPQRVVPTRRIPRDAVEGVVLRERSVMPPPIKDVGAPVHRS